LIAAVAGDAASQTTRKGRKARVAAKKPDTIATEASDGGKDTKPDSKSTAGPAAARHAHLKPGATPKAAEKPAAATEKPAAKPAKPKAAGKPSKPKSTTSEAKPADQFAAPRS
jgi:D-alanyl-D-alanine carboxypeptidase